MLTHVVCVFGDSIVLGTGDESGCGWTGRVARRALAAQCSLAMYNLGVGSHTVDDISGRWRAECEVRMPDSLRGAVIFSFGLNDATHERGQPRVSLRRCLATARDIMCEARERWEVMWIGPIPIDERSQPRRVSSGEVRHKTNAEIGRYDAEFRCLAGEIEVPYLSLFAILSADTHWPALLTDGVHPSARGYSRLASLIGAWTAWRQFVGS